MLQRVNLWQKYGYKLSVYQWKSVLQIDHLLIPRVIWVLSVCWGVHTVRGIPLLLFRRCSDSAQGVRDNLGSHSWRWWSSRGALDECVLISAAPHRVGCMVRCVWKEKRDGTRGPTCVHESLQVLVHLACMLSHDMTAMTSMHWTCSDSCTHVRPPLGWYWILRHQVCGIQAWILRELNIM